MRNETKHTLRALCVSILAALVGNPTATLLPMMVLMAEVTLLV